MRNHLGTYECKLCLTLHNTEVSVLIVTAIIRLLIQHAFARLLKSVFPMHKNTVQFDLMQDALTYL